MAFFACSSACSLPSTSLCPGIHLIDFQVVIFIYNVVDVAVESIEDVMTW